MHTAEGAKSAAKPIVSAITEMKKITDHQVQFTLEAGNADFPYLMSDYHILMFPAGQIEEAIANGIGTGLYKVSAFDPGVRIVGTRVDSHYKDGERGWFDEIEYIAINDNTARMNALLTGQVDAINRIDFKTEALLKANPNVTIQEVTGNQHYTFPMLTNVAPFDDVQRAPGAEIRDQPSGNGRQDPAGSRSRRQRHADRPRQPVLRGRHGAAEPTIPTRPSST